MMELQRFEFLLKIVTKKTGTIDPDMKSEMRTKNYPQSYQFYQSFDILLHKKVGDTRDILSNNALSYLE